MGWRRGSDTLDLAPRVDPRQQSVVLKPLYATGGTVDFTNITDVDDLQVSGSVTLDNLGDGAVDEQITFDQSPQILTIDCADRNRA